MCRVLMAGAGLRICLIGMVNAIAFAFSDGLPSDRMRGEKII
jgi:hypothetical protein